MEEDIDSSVCNENGDNVLTLAVKDKNHKLVKALLSNDVNPNILDLNKQTPLCIAAMIGKDVFDIIFLLLDYGADSNIRDSLNKTVIERLIDAILLIKNKKRMKISDRKNVDESQDYFIILEEILANSEANLKKLNTHKEPYFFEALKYGNLNVVKLLIKHGSDINQPARNGLNVIYNFIANNKSFRREIDQRTYYTNLKTIISIGADVNARDDYGGITLHKAILDNDDQTIKILLNSGADINSIDNRGRNILHNTIWKNKIKQFRLIFSYNKKLLNTPDKFGVLPINYAAFLGYEEMVLELIDTDSQVNNPYPKKRYILNFLERFHKNLIPLIRNTRTLTDKQKMLILVENMIKEFEIELSEEEKKEFSQII
jgi:ankyrin repeat protein